MRHPVRSANGENNISRSLQTELKLSVMEQNHFFITSAMNNIEIDFRHMELVRNQAKIL